MLVPGSEPFCCLSVYYFISIVLLFSHDSFFPIPLGGGSEGGRRVSKWPHGV